LVVGLKLVCGQIPYGEELVELRDLADKIQADKTATQGLAKELMQSKDSEVIDKAYAMACEVNEAVSRGHGKVRRLQWRQMFTLGWLRGRKHELSPPSGTVALPSGLESLFFQDHRGTRNRKRCRWIVPSTLFHTQ
jgi:hypothetical protein